MRLNDIESKKVVVVTGTFPALQPGETIVVEGDWGSHPKYGKQFQATSFEYIATDDNDILEYLASGQFPGVGQKIAERIVEAFGDATADILDNTLAVHQAESAALALMLALTDLFRVKHL